MFALSPKEDVTSQKVVFLQAAMGSEQSCIADGGHPNDIAIHVINNSSKALKLSRQGPCVCHVQHRGFHALHGKFRQGFSPPQEIQAKLGKYNCWVSGRAGSAVKPEGWFSYEVEGGGILKFTYHFINKKVDVESTGPCRQSVTATVSRESTAAFFPEAFGSSLHFIVTLSDNVDPQHEGEGGTAARKHPVIVKASVLNFEYPGWQEVVAGLTQRASEAQAGEGAVIGADCAFLDVIDIRPNQVNATVNHSWDRTVTNEVTHTFHESMGLGVSVHLTSHCPFVSVQTSFSAQTNFGKDQQWREVRHEHVAKSVQLNYSEPGIYRTGCMFMGMTGYTIPFNALVMYQGSLSDGRHTNHEELRDALRDQYEDINQESLTEMFEEMPDGTRRCYLSRRVTGSVFAKTATQMYTVVSRDV
jgi:hypothetical protein